jgi:hypothetical protein
MELEEIYVRCRAQIFDRIPAASGTSLRGAAAIQSLSEQSRHGQAFCRTEFMSSRPSSGRAGIAAVDVQSLSDNETGVLAGQDRHRADVAEP